MIIQYSFDDIASVAKELAQRMQGKKIITFTGMLGAGKTTMIRALLREWGVMSGVTSPTFTYMNQYVTPEGLKIFHFDLYRIKTVDEFIALGFDEYLHRDHSMVLIEWPEVIAPLLQRDDVCHVSLDYDSGDSQKRTLRVQG